MAKSYTQIVGEKWDYLQQISGDIIASVVWSAAPSANNTVTVITPGTGTTATKARFTATVAGNYTLTCDLTGTSGQEFKGRAAITVTN